jgi:hypothetical protein
MAWAARDAACRAMNQARRARFEGLKALLLEADLPRSILHPNTTTNSVRYFRR